MARWQKEIDIPVTAGDYGEALVLTDHVGPGRISISGKFTGILELWASVGAFRADDFGTIIGHRAEGSGTSTWYYTEMIIPRGYSEIRLKCINNISSHADDEIQATYTF